MAKLYSNENFPSQVVDELRKLDHDVLTIQETGRSGQALTDDAVLEFAISQNRSVITLNRKHFIHLHREKPQHDGIIVCSFDPDFHSQAQRIHDIISKEYNLSGKLLRINRPPQ